jgi:hypothetical protein
MRCVVSPVMASRPVTANQATRPSEYRSLRPSTWSPDACSGLMNSGVPTTSPTRVRPRAVAGAALIARAIPKSISRARPVARSSMMFSGLTSRCTTPRPCA